MAQSEIMPEPREIITNCLESFSELEETCNMNNFAVAAVLGTAH